MRYAHILVVFMAGHAAVRGAPAADAAAAQTPATIRSRDRVTVVRIGSDGKIELQDSLPDDVTKKVEETRRALSEAAEQAQKEVERLMKNAERAVDGVEHAPQPQAKPSVTIKQQGTIVVVGPDGVMHTHTFGDEDGQRPDLQELIGKSLEQAGAGLPQADRARLRQALEWQLEPPPQRPDGAGPGAALDAISGKLDRILERREKLEQDVKVLRTTRRSD